MHLLTKILKYQELIKGQTNKLPEYYVIDNHNDFRELQGFIEQSCNPDLSITLLRARAGLDSKEILFLLGTKILIDIIKEK